MSSGGNSGGGYGGGGRPDQLDCNIVERVALASPNAQVIAGQRQGDVLDVLLRVAGDRKSVVAQTGGGDIAGAIVLSSVDRTADLIECLERGKKFKATVQSIKAALCEVEVHPRP